MCDEVLRAPVRLEARLVVPLLEDVQRKGVHEVGRHDVVATSRLLARLPHQVLVFQQRFVALVRVQTERAEGRDHAPKFTWDY